MDRCLHFSSEPQLEKNCILLTMADVYAITDDDMKWSTHDCQDLSDVKPICEYPHPSVLYADTQLYQGGTFL